MNENETNGSTYKPTVEMSAEDGVIAKVKSKEFDGADERMLPKDETKVTPNSEISLKDIKIVMTEKNGDAKLDIAEQKNTFGGMSKEELMKYANDPFWVRLRWFLFITFWLLWAAMLVGAIMIIYAAPKCNPPPPRTWWEVGPLAEIHANTKPEELKSLNKNIKGLIISYNEDAYRPIDESHIVLKLIKQAKESGTEVIIELDPSSSNLWFNESESNNSSFLDYYIWQSPKTGDVRKLPNNWSYLNTSSWIFSPQRNQFYYAPLSKPHLNFRNQIVVEEFAKVIKQFMERGASGIRIRNAPLLLVDPKFEDETVITPQVGIDLGDPGFFKPSKTINVPDLGKLLLYWKETVKNKTNNGLLMVAETLEKVQSYQVQDSLVVDLPILTNIFEKPNVTAIVKRLNQAFQVDNVKWPLWKEHSSSLPPDVVNIVTNLLPGTILISLNSTIDEHLLKIRDSPTIMRGNCDMFAVSNNTVFVFVREISGNPGVLVALNTAEETMVINIKQDIPPLAKLEEVTIQHYSKNYTEASFKDISAKKDASYIPISAKSVLVLQYVPKKND